MRTSINGIQVMHYFEDCKLVAYPDPGSADGLPWTIGYGSTGVGIGPGTVWTQTQADNRFVDDLQRFEGSVAAIVHVPLSQGQFDALVSFAYNLGITALMGSTLLRMLNGLDYKGAADQFVRWNKNNGKPMRGLTRRRAAEAALFAGHNAAEAIKIGVAAG